MADSSVNSLGGYPLGAAEDPNAPYNQKDSEKVKVKVTVSVTYSKDVEVEVEEGFMESDLIETVQEMGILPNDILKEVQEGLQEDLEDLLIDGKDVFGIKKDIKRCTPWHEDELEVIPNF